MRTLEERFWEKVENSSGADCWQWLGHTKLKGYGYFNIGNRISTQAHRVAWKLRRGPIPEGMCVLHRCDNPGCCNPSHLFVDTQAANMEDMVAKGRQASCEDRPNHKLTWDDACWIHVLANQAGWTGAFIAECFGVSESAVREVLIGRNWRTVMGLKHRAEAFEVASR
jgi:hypothetical protein